MGKSIAVSRDGSLGVEVLEKGEPQSISNRLSRISVPLQISLEPRGSVVWVNLLVDSEWLREYEPGWLGLGIPRERVIEELATLAVGELLDHEGLPDVPSEKSLFAAEISLNDVLSTTVKRTTSSDDEILVYLASLLYWADKFREATIRIGVVDYFRLQTTMEDFYHVTRRYQGTHWNLLSMGGLYEPTNRLLTEVSNGIFPGLDTRPIFQVQKSLAPLRYRAAHHHFAKAVDELRNENPDVEAAAKEAVNSLESLAKVILDLPNATLGECVKELRKQGLLRSPLHKTFEAISGFRGVAAGVGHGGTDLPDVTSDEARFVMNISAAGILLLIDLDREAKLS